MIKKSFGIVFLAAIIGTLFMWLVYLLPTDAMAENVIDSKQVLKEKDDTDALLDGAYWKVYDRNTNIIMLYEVIFPGTGDAFYDALAVPTYNFIDDWMQDWSECITEYASEREIEEDTLTYARYWHGYLVFLKPLFLFMNLAEIYHLVAILMLALFVANTYLYYKKLGNYWIAYVVMVFMMNLIRMVQSFQLLSVFAIMQLTLFMVLYFDKWKKEQVVYLFVCDGILIAFFDFLTYPLVACVIPLLTYYLLHKKEPLKDSFIEAFKQGIAFFFGYAGMWFMKWGIATLFTSENIIMDAINSVTHRIGVNDAITSENTYSDVSIAIAIGRNWTSFFNTQNLVLLCLISFVFVILLCIYRKKLCFDKEIFLVCALISLLPFLWISVLSNHAALHPHLEWRNFAIVLFSGVVFVISLFQNVKKGK